MSILSNLCCLLYWSEKLNLPQKLHLEEMTEILSDTKSLQKDQFFQCRLIYPVRGKKWREPCQFLIAFSTSLFGHLHAPTRQSEHHVGHCTSSFFQSTGGLKTSSCSSFFFPAALKSDCAIYLELWKHLNENWRWHKKWCLRHKICMCVRMCMCSVMNHTMQCSL